MSTKPDGGPAFPTTESKRVGEIAISSTTNGLSQRDFFAAAALTGLLARGMQGYDGNNRALCASFEAYEIADSMIWARGQK